MHACIISGRLFIDHLFFFLIFVGFFALIHSLYIIFGKFMTRRN